MKSPSEPKVSECRSCQAPIVWTVTRRGKRMPVDAAPSTAGDFELTSGHDGPPVAIKVSPGYPTRGPGYSCHWDHCAKREKRS